MIHDGHLIERLQQRLRRPLPGWRSQWELASMPGRPREAPPGHRKSGVLSLLYPHQDELHLVFMQRAEDGRVHSGQISFPGGRMEPEDPTLEHTALREAEEELGISPPRVQVLGQLTHLYIPPSNFWVKPVVGFAAERPNFRPDPREVQRVIEVPVAQLLAQPPQDVPVRVYAGLELQAKAFLFDEHIIWGATAMMLNELLTILRDTASI